MQHGNVIERQITRNLERFKRERPERNEKMIRDLQERVAELERRLDSDVYKEN